MRRLGVALTCILLAPGLGGLAACSASKEQTASATSAPVAKEAGAATAGSLVPGQLATFLLEAVGSGVVGNASYTFLSDLVFGSDGAAAEATTEKLDAMQSQLDQITTRLDAIDAGLKSLSGQVAGDALSGKEDDLDKWHNISLSVYKEQFLPIATKAKAVSVARQALADAQNASCSPTATSTTPSTATASPACSTSGTVPPAVQLAYDNALEDLNDAKADFDTAFTNNNIVATFYNQHDALYPAPYLLSVLKLAGQAIETKGYATWTDSQALADMYLHFSDQEALSALLIFEHDKMSGADAATQQRHRDEYVSNNAVERANLPPEIPWAQVKLGTQMFKVPAWPQEMSHGAWLPTTPEGNPLSPYSPRDTETANPGWLLPTAAQLGALYDATKSTPIVNSFWGTPFTHLGSIWQNSGRLGTFGPPSGVSAEAKAIDDFGKTWYWTSDTSASNPLACRLSGSGISNDRVYTLHHVANMAGATAFATQGQPGRIPDEVSDTGKAAECDNELIRLYNNDTYSAYVMLTQPIPAGVDYMALRSTALPAPATPTPTS